MTTHRAYTSCRYGQLHYLEGVPEHATAPTLVLLHQNPSSSFEYRDLVAEMAKDRRVIAFDTPGYGSSDAPPAPPGMTGYAAAIADGIAALGLTGPLDVYGYHTGTLLAAELAIALPEQVARVVYSGIPMFGPEELAQRLQHAVDTPAPAENGEPTIAHIRLMWDYVVAQRDPAVPLDRAVRSLADRIRTLDRYSWAYQGVWSYDFSRLEQVTQPGLLLQPHEDILDVSLAAAARMQNVKVRELPQLDRDIFDVGVAEVAEGLRGFLTGV